MRLAKANHAVAVLVGRGYSAQINARVMHPDHRLPPSDEWEPAGKYQVVYDVLVLHSPSKGMGTDATELRELCDIAESVGLTAQLHYLDGNKIRFSLPSTTPEVLG
jgi:hypothetical protein